MDCHVVVELEVGLRPGEVVQGLEAGCELGVGESVGFGLCLSTLVLARGVDVPRDRLAEAQRSRGGGDQRSVANRARRLQGLATHLHCLFEVTFVQPVYRELDFEDCSFCGRPVGEPLPRVGQAAMGVVVPSQPSDGGALSRQLDPLRDGTFGEELECLQEGRPAAIELPQRAERGGERDAYVDLARVPRQESRGRLEPPRR